MMVIPKSHNRPPLFRLDRARAEADLIDPDGELWPINAYSDADEMELLAETAQGVGILTAANSRARLYVYPMSLAEPEPILAVDPGQGPMLLGHSLELVEREGENPVQFTLRFLEHALATANALVADYQAAGAGLIASPPRWATPTRTPAPMLVKWCRRKTKWIRHLTIARNLRQRSE